MEGEVQQGREIMESMLVVLEYQTNEMVKLNKELISMKREVANLTGTGLDNTYNPQTSTPFISRMNQTRT